MCSGKGIHVSPVHMYISSSAGHDTIFQLLLLQNIPNCNVENWLQGDGRVNSCDISMLKCSLRSAVIMRMPTMQYLMKCQLSSIAHEYSRKTKRGIVLDAKNGMVKREMKSRLMKTFVKVELIYCTMVYVAVLLDWVINSYI